MARGGYACERIGGYACERIAVGGRGISVGGRGAPGRGLWREGGGGVTPEEVRWWREAGAPVEGSHNEETVDGRPAADRVYTIYGCRVLGDVLFSILVPAKSPSPVMDYLPCIQSVFVGDSLPVK